MTATRRVERIELFPLHVPFRAVVRETMARGAGGFGVAIPAEEPWLGGEGVLRTITDGRVVHDADGAIA